MVFDRYYTPEMLDTGIPANVDPYIMDYAMSLYLPPQTYKNLQKESAYNYVWSKSNQTALQKVISGKLSAFAIDKALEIADPLVSTVLSPLKIAAQQTGACPGSTDVTSCLADSLAAVLVKTKPGYKHLIENDVPLSAWVNTTEFTELAKRFPQYVAMRTRIWEEAIPEGHRWRWKKGNGEKSGKVKPWWVIEMQEKQRNKKWTWLPSLN